MRAAAIRRRVEPRDDLITAAGGWQVPRELSSDPVRNRRLRRLAALEQAQHRVAVNYAIVGVQKAGTSTLHELLVQHPNVAAGPEKEMRLFIEDHHDWVAPDFTDYARPAWSRAETMAGDATPAYLFWPGALERMRAYDPGMPIIAIFRDPIERAFSQWSMTRRRNPAFPDLPDTIRRWAHPVLPESIPEGVTAGAFRRKSLYVRGLYGQQLERGLSAFPREQWLLLDLAEIARDHRRALDRATDHLGLTRFVAHPPSLHRGRVEQTNTGPAPTTDEVRLLVDLYAPDLARFAALSDLDISGWATVRVLDGRLTVEELRDRLVARLGFPLDA